MQDIKKEMIIAEYNALSTELLQRYKMLQSVILQCVIFIGAMVYFYTTVFKDYQGEWWTHVIPIFIIPIGVHVIILSALGMCMRTARINDYLKLLIAQHGVFVSDGNGLYGGWADWFGNNCISPLDKMDLSPILIGLEAFSLSCVFWGLYSSKALAIVVIFTIFFHLVLLVTVIIIVLTFLNNVKGPDKAWKEIVKGLFKFQKTV